MDLEGRWPNVRRVSRHRRSALISRSLASTATGRREQAVRLMCVAAETSARFVRERIEIDPMHWLLEPRHMFDDRAAIDACCEPEGFRRAIALHGLALGLDATPMVHFTDGDPSVSCWERFSRERQSRLAARPNWLSRCRSSKLLG